jgi:hypothetical protein
MSRTNVVLLALLALQSIVVAVQILAFGPEAPVSAGPFLDGLSVASVEQVALADGENTVTLRRIDGGWGVLESALYPASDDKTSELLQDLVTMATREKVSHSSAHHVDLEVADASFNRRVEVTTADGAHTFFVGKAGRGGATYVRRAGEDDVFAVSDLSPHALSTRPEAWLERVVFEAERDRIFAIDVRNPVGEFRIERRTLDGWRLVGAREGAPLAGGAVDKLLGKAASVRLKEVVGRADEVSLGEAVAEITVHVAEQSLPAVAPAEGEVPEVSGRAYTLRITADPDDDKTYRIRVDDLPYVVQTTSWSVQPIVETLADDLIEE